MTTCDSAPNPSSRTARRSLSLLALILLLLPALACDDGLIEPVEDAGTDVGVVLNSVDLSLTVFPVDTPGVVRAPVGLGADGSPVSLAVRDDRAVVPMGFVPTLAVVDLASGTLERTVALPTGSGATGVAFANDSIVVVANPNLDSATPVNVLRGTVGESFEVGGFPQGVVATSTRMAVLNGELGPDFSPAGPGTVTVLDRDDLEVLGSVTLTGENPGGVAPAGGDRIWVLNSGSFGAGDGSLSLVDLGLMAEVGHWEGFGEFPSVVAVGADGRLFVGSFSFGVAVWEPSTESFVRAPDAAVSPGGIASVSGLAVDAEGRLHTLLPECSAPGAVNRLDEGFGVAATWPTGTCPIALSFARVGG